LSGFDDLADHGRVFKPARFGTIEVNNMEVAGAFVNPATGHDHWIAAEDSFLGIIALLESHALAVAQVDGRDNEHRTRFSRASHDLAQNHALTPVSFELKMRVYRNPVLL